MAGEAAAAGDQPGEAGGATAGGGAAAGDGATAAAGSADGPAAAGDGAAAAEVAAAALPLFVDEQLPSFFRRLAYTPDGAFLLAPAAQLARAAARARRALGDGGASAEPDAGAPTGAPTPVTLGVHAFARGAADAGPALFLGGLPSAAVAVRCCPRLLALRGGGGADGGGADSGGADSAGAGALCDPPHRALFAVLTLDGGALVYDTQHAAPLVAAQGLHLAATTDAAWASDARALVVGRATGTSR